MPVADRTLEERVPERKNPIGFVSARASIPSSAPARRTGQDDLVAMLALFSGLAKAGTLIGYALAAGQAQGRATWDEITTAQQPPARE